jgi:hypothetical protein
MRPEGEANFIVFTPDRTESASIVRPILPFDGNRDTFAKIVTPFRASAYIREKTMCQE